jgi:hypothetical protein
MVEAPQGPIWPKAARRRMKQSRATIFAISALGLLLGLAQSSPLYAQNQPRSNDCKVEGPSLNDTVNYINNALSRSDHENAITGGAVQTRLSVDGDNLIVDEYASLRPGQSDTKAFSASHQLHQAFSTSLDCPAISSGANNNGTYWLRIPCTTGNSCFSYSVKRDFDDFSTSYGSNKDDLIVFDQCDDICGQRLERAVAHLIAFLQQQTRDKLKRNDDPNDPFAKPQ